MVAGDRARVSRAIQTVPPVHPRRGLRSAKQVLRNAMPELRSAIPAATVVTKVRAPEVEGRATAAVIAAAEVAVSATIVATVPATIAVNARRGRANAISLLLRSRGSPRRLS